jgi:hypothetical protein
MSEPRLRVHRMAGLWETEDAQPVEAWAEEESLLLRENIRCIYYFIMHGYSLVPNIIGL